MEAVRAGGLARNVPAAAGPSARRRLWHRPPHGVAAGGRLVISNPHPFATGVLGWRAGFTDEAGGRTVIPEYPHLRGDYVAAFAAAGLVARRLIEPVLSREQPRNRPKPGHADAFEQALTGAPVVIVWEVERG